MKILIRLIVLAAFIAGALVGYSSWEQSRREARRQERSEEMQTQAQREAILTGQTPPTPVAQPVSPTTEERFRALAQRRGVAVEEFTSLGPREAVVALRGEGHNAIADLLDDARREGLLFDFDVDMLSRNRTAATGPNGERIMRSRFTITFQ